MAITEVLIGDRVRYESAAGTIRGEVVDIVEDLNAANQLINWYVIQYHAHGRDQRVRLAESALPMMKLKVIFRDVQIQIDRGEKEI